MSWKNDTVKLSKSDYTRTLDSIFEEFERVKGVRYYGQFGSVAAPGLSDLDVVAVVDDEMMKVGIPIPKAVRDNPYVCTHLPMIVPRSCLDDLPLFHLIAVDWKSTEKPPLDLEYPVELALTHILDKTLYLQSLFWRFHLQPERPIRRVIMALTSLLRSIEFRASYTGKMNPAHMKFVERMNELRNFWFEPDRQQSNLVLLENLFNEAISISLEVADMIAVDLGFGGDLPIAVASEAFMYRSGCFAIIADGLDSGWDPSDVLRSPFVKRLSKCFGRYAPLLAGRYSFATAPVYRYLRYTHELRRSGGLEFKERHWFHSKNGRALYFDNYTDLRLAHFILKRYEANWRLTKFLDECHQEYANFGVIRSAKSSRTWKDMIDLRISNYGIMAKWWVTTQS